MPDSELQRPRRITCNPADDDEFVGTVERLAATERDALSFEAGLRGGYPSASLDVSVLAGEQVERWYVYRDGHWAGDGTGLIEITAPSAPAG